MHQAKKKTKQKEEKIDTDGRTMACMTRLVYYASYFL